MNLLTALRATFTDGLRDLRKDEHGAESAEVILILGLLVLGLIVAFSFLRDTLFGKIEDTANCIDGAATATTC